MIFTQKIYYNDKPLILTTDSEEYINNNPSGELYTYFHGATMRNFNQALQHLEMPGTKGAIIEDISAVTIQERLVELYTPIDAGGGITYNENGAILMIFRRGKWDLPKGKRDEGESIETCALREVSEETGIKQITLGDKICDTYHVYAQNNELMLKRTAWYKMKASSSEKLKPQKEENIMEARWVNEKELTPLALRTYEAVREVLKLAGLKW